MDQLLTDSLEFGNPQAKRMYLPGIVSNAALPKVISPSSPNRKEIKARRAPKEGRKEGRNREAAGKTERGDANAGGVSMRTKRKGRGRDTRRIAATFASVTLPYFWASRYSQDAQAHLLERLLRWEVSRTWAKEQNRRTILYEVGTRPCRRGADSVHSATLGLG